MLHAATCSGNPGVEDFINPGVFRIIYSLENNMMEKHRGENFSQKNSMGQNQIPAAILRLRS
jgi:hypothetical protein